MKSDFNGGAFSLFFRTLLSNFVSVITLGLGYPFMRCWLIKWRVQHTYINGKRLCFTGSGGGLFGKYVLWLLLSLITLGIYYIVKMKLNLIEWETKNTHLEGEPPAQSQFDGKWYQLLGVNLWTVFVVAITFSLGIFWAFCYQNRWTAKHKTIDGNKLVFTGSGIQFFGKCICWILLTAITLGIYSFWLPVKIVKWQSLHTEFEKPFVAAQSQSLATGAEPAVCQPEQQESNQPARQNETSQTATANVLAILAVVFGASGIFNGLWFITMARQTGLWGGWDFGSFMNGEVLGSIITLGLPAFIIGIIAFRQSRKYSCCKKLALTGLILDIILFAALVIMLVTCLILYL